MPFWLSQGQLSVFGWAARAVVILTWLFFLTKMLGKREVGRLSGFDLVVLIALIATASGPLHTARDGMLGPIVTTGVIALIDIVLSYLGLTFPRMRRLLQDEPVIVVQNGRILEKAMRQVRLNTDQLMMEIRQKNTPNLADVEFAILEANGNISVIPKSQARPVTPRDLHTPTPYEGLPTVLINDGCIEHRNLQKNGLSEAWLHDQMRAQGIDDVEDVLLATLDTQGKLYVSRKGEHFLH